MFPREPIYSVPVGGERHAVSPEDFLLLYAAGALDERPTQEMVVGAKLWASNPEAVAMAIYGRIFNVYGGKVS